MNWNYRKGDYVVFNTVQSDLLCHNGKTFEVLRRLTEDEADLFETGPMYEIGVVPWTLGSERLTVHAFEDELTLTDEGRFFRMLDLYRALGYRMVAFEKECEGGWIQVFDTHGIDATTLPKSAFKVPANEPWERLYGWDIEDEDTRVFDETDDPWFLVGSYDFTGNFPVLQLAE